MIETLLPFAIPAFISSLLVALYRLIRGPTAPDRVIAGDAMTTITVALLVFLSFHYREAMLLDIAILVALLGFIGTLTISKYLEGREVGD